MRNHDNWYRKMPGSMLLADEKVWLDRVLKKNRARILLQLGGPFDDHLTDSAPVSKTIFVGSDSRPKSANPVIQANADALPIDSDSVDIVLLMHVLESTPNAVGVLQEAHRVLKPNGKIIVFGFNRFGVWNLLRFLTRKHFSPWVGKCFSIGKVKRKLRATDCSVTIQQTICFRPPFENAVRAKRWFFLETWGQFFFPYFGSVFMVVAIKNVAGMTPLIDALWAKKIGIGNQVPEPSMRNF
ncbi:MAG: hypothetical protein COY58_08965 [Gammaproteobacteria bacterium CG_4_10_14_0_8_um_filter_38_16]|nr:MAG: hypothetical protein COY58_08965 [Gammaproteobacteria bacterium CG_4_10_14_0_8_um_filter_38_16]PJA02951.1 MAG: hypothetical protein COX72_07990 [Gammaproteobacteria bacterium CG_4_10_14_0_2_um_filter_38_22]PJB11382.1 MAG: hypothetical protein CO120_00250 [Gammaproteobacteria bacterium CG_4_9_14_3_um_filter_38_9]